MKTIYLRQKSSGNFEVSNRQQATHVFKSKKDLVSFFDGEYKNSDVINEFTGKPLRQRISNPKTSGKIIKASYRLSQTYYKSGLEFYQSLKK